MMPETDLQALERFVVENDDLLSLEEQIGRFNIFDALSIARVEIRPWQGTTVGVTEVTTPAAGSHRTSRVAANGSGDLIRPTDPRRRRGGPGGIGPTWPCDARAGHADHELAVVGSGYSGGDFVPTPCGNRKGAGDGTRAASDRARVGLGHSETNVERHHDLLKVDDGQIMRPHRVKRLDGVTAIT